MTAMGETDPSAWIHWHGFNEVVFHPKVRGLGAAGRLACLIVRVLCVYTYVGCCDKRCPKKERVSSSGSSSDSRRRRRRNIYDMDSAILGF